MKKSNLQFKDPHIEQIDFRISSEQNPDDDMPINIEIKPQINGNEANVKMILKVGNIDQDNKVTTHFYFCGIISSDFIWNENIKDPESMLKISGGTVLLSYLRPILANLTMQAGLRPLNFPFINFTE